ncbi:MAG: hypothetical protein L0I24_12360, partial [Pseudonocardia sp.]|nr:hypothetical protein [Pseudonocardia sp.]
MRLVLDAEAVTALVVDGHSARRHVQRHLATAHRLGRPVCIASVTLAELYRGRRRTRAVDALRSRLGDLLTRDTDPDFARLVGSILFEAGVGSAHLADAHAVAVAVEVGG